MAAVIFSLIGLNCVNVVFGCLCIVGVRLSLYKLTGESKVVHILN